MIILLVFAFLAGIVTILSPCILPILPVILATSATDLGSRRKPYGIVVGFILSFTFFTLFLSSIVKLFGVSSDLLRTISIIVIALFGLSLLLPRFNQLVETLFSRLSSSLPHPSRQDGFGGGVMLGLSLGLLWTPCVGPILASVISLAVAGTITREAFFITLAYSLGTAIPMYLVIRSGQKLFTRVPWLLQNTTKIQRGFGVVMLALSLALYTGFDRSFESYVISRFPQYGSGLTAIEDNSLVQTQLQDVAKGASLPKKGTAAPELVAGGEWFNLPQAEAGSPPLTLTSLRGKVVLIDFWTYTCINCQRTLPYVKNWYDKYHDQGLEVIGVHSPEFEFEKEASNVQKAIADFGIKYPVMQDNNFATWQAYSNNYWPAKYLIDKDGNIRYTHFGEGDYDQTEAAIQSLLTEAGASVSAQISNPEMSTFARTPETYLGSKRGGDASYLSYEGKWTTSPEYNTPSSGSKLNLQFNAKSVYLVMRNNGSPATVHVYLDGDYLQDIAVDSDKLYTLVELSEPGSHKLQLQFDDDHAELFAFTFG